MINNEMLNYAIENGMIDYDTIQKNIEMNKRKKYLEEHQFKIWKGKDGKYYTYLPNEEKGRILKKRNTRKEIENIIVEYYTQLEENPTVKAVYQEWVEDKLRFEEIGRATYDRYNADFNRYFGSIRNRKVRNVEEYELEDFVKTAIRDYKMTSKCFSNFRTLIYGIFKRAKKKGLISYSITETMKDMEISQKSFRKIIRNPIDQIYTSKEKPLMETYLEEHIDIINLGLLLMFKTGLRVGELSSIKRCEVKNYTVPINRTETRYKDADGNTRYEVKDFPKTEAGIRCAIVPTKYEWIIDKILELNPDDEYLFSKKGKRIKTYSFRRRLRYICESKICISPKSPHKVRKTYATILIDGKVRQSTLLEAMGHTDIEVAQNHYYYNRTGVEEKRIELGNVAEL